VRSSAPFWLFVFAFLAAGLYALTPGNSGNGRARIMAARADVRAGIKAALDQYQADNGRYPASLHELWQSSSNTPAWHGPYLDPPKSPIDPWGDPYIYHYPGKHNPDSYDLLSAGPDGKEGTADDIGNWQ
jgi:general secretion pathway protein G